MLFCMSTMPGDPGHAADNDFAAARAEMVREVEAMAREAGSYTGRRVLDERVIEALSTVPRHKFVPENMRSRAYLNRPQPIGHDQTISQPFIVALMTDLAGIQAGEKVLEIGTGSGYQAAVLAELGAEIYTIEIIPELGEKAARILNELAYENIHTRISDGYQGWPEAAPFDAILLTAAPESVPQTLVDQLAADGRMIVPVGARGGMQTLTVVQKKPDGSTVTREVVPVSFVPMVQER